MAKCKRCQGFLVQTFEMDKYERIRSWRCVNCGEYTDVLREYNREVQRSSRLLPFKEKTDFWKKHRSLHQPVQQT